METVIKRAARYFATVGAADIRHTGDKNYLAHVIGVYNDLKAWQCPEHVCLAGLFHSVYGTELFQRFALPLDRRDEVRRVIGNEAEQLAYLNCAMDRSSFDTAVQRWSAPHVFRDRFTGETIRMDTPEFIELVTLHLCDWLEQVERSGKWDYRRDAYRAMAERLGGIALEQYRAVFAREPAGRTAGEP